MNNTEIIKWSSEISEKTNHELIRMLYQRHEEMRIILSILNRREEEKFTEVKSIMKDIVKIAGKHLKVRKLREVIKLSKKGKPKEEQKPKQ